MHYQAMRRHTSILNAYYKVKEVNQKGYILYDFYSMTCQKRQNYEEREKISDCLEVEMGGGWIAKHRGYLGQ